MKKNTLAILLLLVSFGLNAQSVKATEAESIKKSKSNSSQSHSIGLAFTIIGPLEVNYEYRFANRFSLRAGLIPLSSEYLSFQAVVGLRASLLSKNKFELYSGLDYNHVHINLDLDDLVGIDNEYRAHLLEIPLGIKYHFNERFSIDLSQSAGYRLGGKSKKDGIELPLNQNNNFQLFSRARIGLRYTF